MALTTAKYRWLVLAAYPAAGLFLGLADPLLGRLVQQLGMKPGVATAMSVNAFLPLVAVTLGVAYPRLVSVWAGAVCMTVGFGLGLAAPYHHGEWSLAEVPPVLVAAALGYAAVGTITLAVPRLRRSLRAD
jgi:hypothetical protein